MFKNDQFSRLNYLKVGQKVRISKAKKLFDKGFERNWSREIFVVSERIARIPPVYRVQDLAGELIQGVFYSEELQPITKEDDEYRIEKIIRKKKVRGRYRYLIRWEGYPKSFDSWIGQEDLRPI